MLKSFGIEVADIAQLPRSVVDSAKSYLSGLETMDVDEDCESMKKIDDILDRIEKDKILNNDMIDSIFCWDLRGINFLHPH